LSFYWSCVRERDIYLGSLHGYMEGEDVNYGFVCGTTYFGRAHAKIPLVWPHGRKSKLVSGGRWRFDGKRGIYTEMEMETDLLPVYIVSTIQCRLRS
jgi:hypothetical protein